MTVFEDIILCVTANRDVVLSKVDFIICIGGDGTILYTASLFKVQSTISRAY